MIADPEFQRRVAEIQFSPTMNQLVRFGERLEIDPANLEDVRAALATATLALVQALDAERITFSEDTDAAMFYGLMAVAVSVVLGERPKSEVVRCQ